MNHITELLNKLEGNTLLETDSPDMKECNAVTCKNYDIDESSNCALAYISVNKEGKCKSFNKRTARVKGSKHPPTKGVDSIKEPEPNFVWDETTHSFKRVAK